MRIFQQFICFCLRPIPKLNIRLPEKLTSMERLRQQLILLALRCLLIHSLNYRVQSLKFRYLQYKQKQMVCRLHGPIE